MFSTGPGSLGMEASPLTQQERPTSLQPKILRLYEHLFEDDNEQVLESDGFWREFFLLSPDTTKFRQKLEELYPGDLLHFQRSTQMLFAQGTAQMKAEAGPMDENALDTLTVFLDVVLSKRYTNQSSDIITLIAGLDQIDPILIAFAGAVDGAIRNGRTEQVRRKAIRISITLLSGAYQTSLVSYFIHRDFFPSSIKYVQESSSPDDEQKVFLLLSILANSNKFEFKNPYRVRLEDFINESAIRKLSNAFGMSMSIARDQYVAIQEDKAEGWSISSTLAYIGLGRLVTTQPTALNKASDTKGDFGTLPDASVAILLGAYEFAVANKVFCHHLISCPEERGEQEPPFSSFLSFVSYLLQHAYRSSRASSYGLVALLIIRVIIEDAALCKMLCDSESAMAVRLCRQRQPFLPATPKRRPPITSILDILIDTINHNLRRHLDMQLYISALGLIHRALSYLTFTRTSLAYHWSLLWQTLISFLRFLTTYAPSFPLQDPDLPLLLQPLLAALALSVASGESFLPDPAAYDDLFYKLVEAGDILTRFKKAYGPLVDEVPPAAAASGAKVPPIDTLIQVSSHYHDLVSAERSKGRLGNNPSPREVSKIIRQGYESLSLSAMDGLDMWDRFREGEERGMLKRAARIAVDDAKRLVKT